MENCFTKNLALQWWWGGTKDPKIYLFIFLRFLRLREDASGRGEERNSAPLPREASLVSELFDSEKVGSICYWLLSIELLSILSYYQVIKL